MSLIARANLHALLNVSFLGRRRVRERPGEGAPMRHTGPALAAAVALVALALVAVGACGGNGVEPGGGKTPPPAAAADITGRLSQLSAAADGAASLVRGCAQSPA